MTPRTMTGISLLSGLLAVWGGVLGGCAYNPPAEADAVFKKGLEQAEAGDVKTAMKTLQGGVNSYPRYKRMRFELARLQYETGESYHLKERAAMRKAAVFLERRQRDEAAANRREANASRARAAPFYDAARVNLREIVSREDNDTAVAWASFLLMRVDVFFEDWEAADEDLQRAIDYGRPTGSLLAQWREFQAGIRQKLKSRLGE